MDLYIELAHSVELKFRILETPIAELWLERMALRNSYLLDHPNRFYGFDTPEQERQRANIMMLECIETINSYRDIINRKVDITDQDCLNYLHNIFERFHGLLDSQDTEFYQQAPDRVKRALADLNLCVHRCESVNRKLKPRFVCTWYGLPKTNTLTDELMQQHGTVNPKWGSVCLNYAEIGKTLEHLTQDRDSYIADQAFKPFNYYSADFVVRFFEDSMNEVAQRIIAMAKYYNDHTEFFVSRGYTDISHPRLMPLYFPVAELVETMPREQLLELIQTHQVVTRVHIE
jgi:hypothetical protein